MRHKILEMIERNARIDVKDLALILEVSELDIVNEISAMEKEGIICAYHTIINWDATSKEKVVALIEVKVTPQRGMGFDKMADRIMQYEEVSSLYLMSGAFDFTLLLEGKTMKEVAMFVSEKLAPLESILSTSTHFVLKKYKEHGTVIGSKKIDEREMVS